MRNLNDASELYNLPKENIPEEIYQLKIKLNGISPPIWRRILVSNKIYFSELHYLIQRYFSWGGYHLHEFYYSNPYVKGANVYIKGIIEWDVDTDATDYHFNADEIRLCDVFTDSLKRVHYIYDFGDYWHHIIMLEKTYPYNSKFRGPICVGGKRAPPPEDSGGPYGYQEMLEIIDNPEHPEYEEINEWLGGKIDANEVTEIDMKMSPRMIEKEFGKKSN